MLNLSILATFLHAMALCLALTTVLSAAAPSADLKPDFVRTLINSSSAARQVEASGIEAAIERREHARNLLARAVESEKSGDHELAQNLLKRATQAMFEAVSLVDPGERTDAKKNMDFDARLESAEALLEAFGRISLDKNSADRDSIDGQIREHLSRARLLREQGDIDGARESLDQGYTVAKNAIDVLRGGDTLVRTLEFATKEEEYRYELDRNDTHRMLVTVLLEKKLESPGVRSMVTPFLDKASELRNAAERQASTGDFENAIGTLEESTRHLVRAIRGAGVYIPG